VRHVDPVAGKDAGEPFAWRARFAAARRPRKLQGEKRNDVVEEALEFVERGTPRMNDRRRPNSRRGGFGKTPVVGQIRRRNGLHVPSTLARRVVTLGRSEESLG